MAVIPFLLSVRSTRDQATSAPNAGEVLAPSERCAHGSARAIHPATRVKAADRARVSNSGSSACCDWVGEVLHPRARARSLAMMDETFMAEALAAARLAAAEGEAPVGAVLVADGRIAGRGRNARERLHDPTAHAEILALQEASRTLGRWRLTGSTMYATLEPCPMCAGALVNARVDRLVYAVTDPKAGAV